MRTSTAFLLSALSMAAAPAAAQSSGFYYNGIIAADYARVGANTVTAGLIDMRFGVAPDAAGSFGGVGFEAGVFGFASSGSSAEATGFAALTFALGGGVLHVGAPRSAVHGYNTTPIPTGAQAALLEVGLFTGALPYSTYYAISANRPMLGVMYEREAGPLRYSVSYGQINAGGAVNVAGFGIARQFDAGRVFGTIEHLWASGGHITTASVGGSTTLGGGTSSLRRIELGGAVSARSQTGSPTQGSVSVYATAALTDRLDVTASVMRINLGGGAQTLVGVNAAYDVWNGVTLNAGVGRSGGGGSIWTVGLSRRF